MRVIEPNQKPSQVQKSATKRTIRLLFVLVLLVVGGWYAYGFFSKDNGTQTNANVSAQQTTENQTTDASSDFQTGEFIEFSGNEFRLLYDNLLQPNLVRASLPPTITGNDIADARIRSLAELRGYKLRSSPVEGVLVYVDGYPVQQPVVAAWQAMQASAASAGFEMSIVSAYRSVDDQRVLFLSRLEATGVSIADVIAGVADEQITGVLVTSSIPGYSKHHTGYTLDLACAGYVFEQFRESPCYSWMSANNYENAKRFGFIPSYPADADLQGPDPEAWEYVWVGLEVVSN